MRGEHRSSGGAARVPGLAIVRALAIAVPAARREEWVAEWRGELCAAWRRAGRDGTSPLAAAARNCWRALGAVADVLWMRRRHGATTMIGLDLRYATRSLRRRPGFVAVVVLTLALGVGATTAIFSIVDGVLLRPLAFADPERLVVLRGAPTDGDAEKVGPAESYPDFLDFRAQTRAFEQLAAASSTTATLTAPGAEPARISAGYITASLLGVLGVRPMIGRGFLPDDEMPGAPAVAILSHVVWLQRWGGDPHILGQSITIDGVPVTVVGVLAPGVRLLAEMRIIRPLVPAPQDMNRGRHLLSVVGRLAPGVSIEQADREARAIARRLEIAYPADNAERGAHVEPLRDALVHDARPGLLMLLGAVVLVLLIGCTNLASLFLARAASREHEMALRSALGAGNGRLVRQWMTESLLLSLTGGIAGLAVAWLGMHALLATAPAGIPRAEEITLDGRVLGFLFGTSVAVGIVFGLLPALHQRRAGGSWDALRDGARGATGARSRRGLRQALVIGEVALATVLAIGASLLVKSYWRLERTELAVRPEGVLLAQLQLPAARYDSARKVLQFYQRLRDEVRAIPGVHAVSFAYENPTSAGWTSSYTLVGRSRPSSGNEPESRVRPVWPGYFAAVGLPLRRGRDVAETDRLNAPGAVVVNEAFVRRHFGGEDPIGQVIDRDAPWWPGQPRTFTIVGVVADEPFMGVGRPAEPATYYPHMQFPLSDMWLVVGAAGDVASLAPELRRRIWRVDPDLPVESVTRLGDLLGASVAAPRFNALLLSLFAAAAVLIAAVGIYGVLAYSVAQRTGEIGVRIALGAARGRVVRHIAGQGIALASAGVVAGLAGALGLARLLQSLLVGVDAHDPAVFAAAGATLAIVAALASWLPARRASLIEPVAALRGE